MRHQDLYYVLPTVKPGDSISWGSLSRDPEIRNYEYPHEPGGFSRGTFVNYTGVLFTPIPYCTYGDYDNSSLTERSNHRVIRAEFPWLVHVYDNHGSEMIGYLGKRENQNSRLIEAIESLESYPVYDEDDESELEMTLEWEAWCDHGRQDFAKDLVKLLNGWFTTRDHEIDVPTEDSDPMLPQSKRHRISTMLDEIWHDGCDRLNVNGGSGMVIESGGNVHFYVDDWIEKASRYLTKFGVGSDQPMHDALVALSKQCGYLVPDEDVEADLYVQRALVAMWLGWNGTASPRELVKQCTDVESCSVLGDYLDERMPTEAPSRQLEILL